MNGAATKSKPQEPLCPKEAWCWAGREFGWEQEAELEGITEGSLNIISLNFLAPSGETIRQS